MACYFCSEIGKKLTEQLKLKCNLQRLLEILYCSNFSFSKPSFFSKVRLHDDSSITMFVFVFVIHLEKKSA